MKRQLLLCDGTWNTPEGNQSHIARLENVFTEFGDDGVPQLVEYVPGVGISQDASWIVRAADQYGGGAFGWGVAGQDPFGF